MNDHKDDAQATIGADAVPKVDSAAVATVAVKKPLTPLQQLRIDAKKNYAISTHASPWGVGIRKPFSGITVFPNKLSINGDEVTSFNWDLRSLCIESAERFVNHAEKDLTHETANAAQYRAINKCNYYAGQELAKQLFSDKRVTSLSANDMQRALVRAYTEQHNIINTIMRPHHSASPENNIEEAIPQTINEQHTNSKKAFKEKQVEAMYKFWEASDNQWPDFCTLVLSVYKKHLPKAVQGQFNIGEQVKATLEKCALAVTEKGPDKERC